MIVWVSVRVQVVLVECPCPARQRSPLDDLLGRLRDETRHGRRSKQEPTATPNIADCIFPPDQN